MTQTEPEREKSLQDYRKKLVEHKEVESRLKESEYILGKL
jgi:26S proteasome regulatory subunit T4